LGAASDEQGERFYQDMASFEKRYKGFWDGGMLSDYCWMHGREVYCHHERISNNKVFIRA